LKRIRKDPTDYSKSRNGPKSLVAKRKQRARERNKLIAEAQQVEEIVLPDTADRKSFEADDDHIIRKQQKRENSWEASVDNKATLIELNGSRKDKTSSKEAQMSTAVESLGRPGEVTVHNKSAVHQSVIKRGLLSADKRRPSADLPGRMRVEEEQQSMLSKESSLNVTSGRKGYIGRESMVEQEKNTSKDSSLLATESGESASAIESGAYQSQRALPHLTPTADKQRGFDDEGSKRQNVSVLKRETLLGGQGTSAERLQDDDDDGWVPESFKILMMRQQAEQARKQQRQAARRLAAAAGNKGHRKASITATAPPTAKEAIAIVHRQATSISNIDTLTKARASVPANGQVVAYSDKKGVAALANDSAVREKALNQPSFERFMQWLTDGDGANGNTVDIKRMLFEDEDSD
jgi:hypothetical protein